MDMVRAILAGDQAGELEWYPGQSRSDDRRRGCRAVGGGGCERHAAHPRWPRHRTCPGGPDKRRDLLEASCGHRGHVDHPRVRCGQAFPDRYPALGLRVDSGPIGAVARDDDFARALAFYVVLAPAVEIARAIAFSLTLTLTLAFAYGVPLVIPVVGELKLMVLR